MKQTEQDVPNPSEEIFLTWLFYWPAHRAGLLRCIFFGQPGSVSKFPPFLWVKLWVGWVGRGYIEISRYFPALWINRFTLVTKIKLWYSLGYQITFESPKCLYGMLLFLHLEAWFNLCSIPFLPQQPCKVFSHWLIIYPREYRLQHSPNLVDVGL